MTKTEITVPKSIKRKIRISEAILVGELAKRMGVKSSEVIKKLMELGMMVTINQAIDAEAASLVAADFGYEVEKTGLELEDLIEEREDRAEDLVPRPPVVTIMGHVDHGNLSSGRHPADQCNRRGSGRDYPAYRGTMRSRWTTAR